MNLFDRILSGLTETGRDRYTDAAAAELVPLAVEYRSIPGLSPSIRDRDLRLAEERYAR